jgi:hypothetical protein
VLVEEKTQLQSQLRQTVAIANAKVAEMDRIQVRVFPLISFSIISSRLVSDGDENTPGFVHDNRTGNERIPFGTRRTREDAVGTEGRIGTTSTRRVAIGSARLRDPARSQRRSSASIHLHAFTIVGGLLQARLKAKCQDTERLTSELEALRKQLSMQDIYIKQLSHHAAGLVEYQAMHDALSTVNSIILSYSLYE